MAGLDRMRVIDQEEQGVAAGCLHPEGLGLDRACGRAVGSGADGGMEGAEGKVALVVQAGEPLRGDTADSRPAGDIDFVRAGHGGLLRAGPDECG